LELAKRHGVFTIFNAESISPVDLGVALEEREFDSLLVTEHSHIAHTPDPMGSPIPPQYYGFASSTMRNRASPDIIRSYAAGASPSGSTSTIGCTPADASTGCRIQWNPANMLYIHRFHASCSQNRPPLPGRLRVNGQFATLRGPIEPDVDDGSRETCRCGTDAATAPNPVLIGA
jgi:hypothetical protein